jgi:Ser/Thr protein kinase RdoA (MazF antagonist)
MQVTTSVIAAKALAGLVALEYELETPLKCQLLRVKDNDHYLLTAGEANYILRVYSYQKHWVTKESYYYFELEWLTYLHEHNLPVSYPIARKGGDFLGILHAPEGDRYFALFSFAPGKNVFPMNAEQSRLFGKGIAQIHLTSDHFRTEHPRFHQDTDWLIDRPLGRIETFLNGRRPKDVEFLKELASTLKNTFTSLPLSAPYYGIIGGDFHGGNNFFSEDNQITFFDFDLCGYGWRAYDLAIFLWSVKLNDGIETMWTSVLQGYEEVRPLSDIERASLPALVKVRSLWLMGSHTTYVDKFGDAWLGDRYWEQHIGHLRKWIEEENNSAKTSV